MTKNKFYNLCLVVASFLFLISSSVSGQDTNLWTQFRGTSCSGIDATRSADLIWADTDYAWQTTLIGSSNASPVVWDNTIFVTSAIDSINTGYAMAIDGENGQVIWKKEFNVPDLKMHVDNDLAAPTPAVDKSQVYVIWYSKDKTTLYALSHDGQVQWEANFGGIEARHGGGSSLLLTDKYVVFTREQENFSALRSSWVAVDKRTGRTAWELERESAEANSFSTPLLIKMAIQSYQLVFASQAHGLTGVDPETGTVLWEQKNFLPARAVASPIYSDGLIVACRKGGALVFDLKLSMIQEVDTARYSLPRALSPYVPTPIVVDGLLFLFLDNGTVACVQFDSGELLWKEKPAGAIYGSPICVGDYLYCMTKDGSVIVIRADSKYQLQGIHQLGDGSFSTPVMCESGIVFRTFSKLTLVSNSHK